MKIEKYLRGTVDLSEAPKHPSDNGEISVAICHVTHCGSGLKFPAGRGMT